MKGRPIIWTVKKRDRVTANMWGSWITIHSAATRAEIYEWLDGFLYRPLPPTSEVAIFYNRKIVREEVAA